MRRSYPNARSPADGSNINVKVASSPAKAKVRYLEFERIADGSRLRFHVKSTGQPAIEVTFDIPNTVFTSTFGVSIQDAAPMAYEKFADLLATEHSLEAMTLFLTVADIGKSSRFI